MAEDRFRTEDVTPPTKLEKKDPEFKEIEKRREFDREMHAKKAKEAGVPDDVAESHAEEDVESGARVEGKP